MWITSHSRETDQPAEMGKGRGFHVGTVTSPGWSPWGSPPCRPCKPSPMPWTVPLQPMGSTKSLLARFRRAVASGCHVGGILNGHPSTWLHQTEVSIHIYTAKRMVYSGKSHEKGWFGGTPISGNHQISRWTLWTAHASWKPQWFKSGPWILAARFLSLDLLSWPPSLVWIYWKTCSPVASWLVFRRGFWGCLFCPWLRIGTVYPCISMYINVFKMYLRCISSNSINFLTNVKCPMNRLPGLKLPSPKTLTQGYEAWPDTKLVCLSIMTCKCHFRHFAVATCFFF